MFSSTLECTPPSRYELSNFNPLRDVHEEDEASLRSSVLERMIEQLYAENDLLKKALAMTEKKVREERIKPRQGGDI
jgi:hypothetical protein